MHDIKKIRNNPEKFDSDLKRKGEEPCSTHILSLDRKRRLKILESEEAQAKKNIATKETQQAKQKNDEENFHKLRKLVSDKKSEIASLDQQAKSLSQELNNFLLKLPNLPSSDVPDGESELENVEIKKWGELVSFNFKPKEHYLLAASKGMNFKDAARISGSRFVVLHGAMATLHRAIAQFMIDLHVKNHGLTEVWAPVLVNKEAMKGTGQLPKFNEDSYSTTDGYWLIPTSEVSLTNLFSEKIIKNSDLPIRLTSHSQCFRSEAGSAGKDTAGMLRQHQFEKVEMVSISNPSESEKELERMTRCAEKVLEALELPYRTVLLCTGDTGFCAHKTYDIEVWLPGQNKYREISSCSLCGDFQARRMNARYRPNDESKPEYLHTLNGSGLAVGRCLIAILENYQQADGTVKIPTSLKPYLSNSNKISNKGILE